MWLDLFRKGYDIIHAFLLEIAKEERREREEDAEQP